MEGDEAKALIKEKPFPVHLQRKAFKTRFILII